jgi:hypothetical protein
MNEFVAKALLGLLLLLGKVEVLRVPANTA